MNMTGSPLVSTNWLAQNLDSALPVDGSWYLPQEGRNTTQEFLDAHIPGAVRFDLDATSRPSPLPHMMPEIEFFSATMSALGVSDGDTIVVYDTAGLFSAARVRWMFRAFGATRVYILDGGLPKWRAEGRTLESGASRRKPSVFNAKPAGGAVAEMSDVRKASEKGAPAIIDARPSPRFAGLVAEPRQGVRPGHIPGSRNVPYSSLIEAGRLKGASALASVFRDAGVDTSAHAITSCGSGVTAAIVSLGLEMLGQNNVALYDGSWAEWGADASAPLEVGPPRPLTSIR